MSESFAGKVALVTGGGGGIGRATAEAFAREGARVVVADRDESSGAETVRRIQEAGGEARFVPVDVTAPAAVDALIAATVAAYGRLDFAHNNAGILGPDVRTADYPEDTWRQVLDINLTGVWLCMRAEIRQMLTQGGGVIVNTASNAGLAGFAGHAAYSASKHGVIGLTKSAAREYARKGIRVNAVCPGFTQTPMLDRSAVDNPERVARLTAAVPMNRLGTPEEVAGAVVWLCSTSAGYVTGTSIVLDGGLMT
jgi:NAD(P)-dependent dehydrogenase (short-subunit alcohol dehydrogenase family)